MRYIIPLMVLAITLFACKKDKEPKPLDVQAILNGKIDRLRNWHHYSYSYMKYSTPFETYDTLSDTGFALIRMNNTSLQLPDGAVANLDSSNKQSINFSSGYGYHSGGSNDYNVIRYYYNSDSIIWERGRGGNGGGGSDTYITF
ncbi:MAG: hypothetical protein EOP51_01070 [Sphingobacteriales bacterium]|nr:MAG: hypothetical protein EOP51_01070 [Sphingobacteriales bacterium]